MENQSQSIETSVFQHSKKYTLVIVSFICIIIFLSVGLIYSINQNNQLKKQLTKNETPPIETEATQVWSIAPEISKSVQEITNQLLSDTLEYTKGQGEVPVFTKEFDLSQNNGWANLVITVYRYSPGATIKEGYEGFTWQRNLDTEINQLKQLKQLTKGTYITQSISSGQEQTYSIITTKDIGNIRYVISNTYFQPSRSWHRHYQAFDEHSNQLIDVTMGISPDKFTVKEKPICYEEKCASLTIYPLEIENFFLEEESLLEE
jgi:hypothetical protein